MMEWELDSIVAFNLTDMFGSLNNIQLPLYDIRVDGDKFGQPGNCVIPIL